MAIKVAKKKSIKTPTPAGETKKRTLAKTISWRTVASLDTFLIGFVVLQFVQSTAEAAALIALVEIPNKLLIYYIHERVWAKIRYGLPKREEYSI